jgi:penicillin amidase
MLQWMRAGNWTEFRQAMEHYYSPGVHLVYADTAGHIAYQTLVHVPRTRWTSRLALEGWTGKDEVTGRIPLDEMPNMLDPAANFISHANNLPAGSWYPHDLGLGKGGSGDSVRSMRLRQLLTGDRKFSLDDFESLIHRDSVNPAVAALLPVARKVVDEDRVNDPDVQRLLASLKDWNHRLDAGQSSYSMAVVLCDAATPAFRRSNLSEKLGGGESGVCHLARVVGERFARDGVTPRDPAVRAYLVDWLRLASAMSGKTTVPIRHAMPYQAGARLGFPSLDKARDLISPPMTCGHVGTIWSQAGNSYSQIVDLADVDRSRSVLPPGISEDPDNPFHASQLPLWAKGTTHPAPLSRKLVETMASSRTTLTAARYEGPDRPPERTVAATGEARVIPAIPK